MNDAEFKEKVYGPYNEAWKILRIIQDAGQNKRDDETWQKYMNEIDRFCKTNEGNHFAQETLTKMLIDAGEDIAKMNRRGEDAV